MKRPTGQGGGQLPRLPDRAELLAFAAGRPGPPRLNELVQAFALRPGARPALKRLIKELQEEGVLAQRRTRETAVEGLPPVGVIELTTTDADGDLLGRSELAPKARIRLPAEALEGRAPGVGDRCLVRLMPRGPDRYDAHLMKVLPRQAREVVGVLEPAGDGMRLRPAERGAKTEYRVGPDDLGGAAAGDLVRAAVLPGRSSLALPRARVAERLGRPDDPTAVSLGVAVRQGLPMAFAAEALALAGKAKPVRLGRRKDLREVDLVTIDGADARDFDDAVWAAPDPAKSNPGGHVIVVAIADVAHYVRPGDALDQAARERGNSVYFPDCVISMLPEALSNELCSLRPEVERACFAAFLTIDREGQLVAHRFRRALMRSRARLTYEQAQAAHDGFPDSVTEPLLERVVRPLFAAYEVLAAARRRRGALELDLPERRILFDAGGHVTGVARRQRLASHMLIEEFMILANVAAATVLEEGAKPGFYRVHDKPDPARLEALGEYLERLGIPWSRADRRPGDLTALLGRIKDEALRETVAGFVLRSQAQAVYSPRNLGHFGLHLRRYAHFTSPIRRYSDLVVHRALIDALDLGGDGLDEAEGGADGLVELGQHLSRCERRAMEAERAAIERFVAIHMADQVGAEFAAKVTGVQRFGLFVALPESGAEGLVPVSTLGDDAFVLDERFHALVGQRYGQAYGLGDTLTVSLAEADPVTGGLSFRVVRHEPGAGAELAAKHWSKAGGRRAPVPPRRLKHRARR